MRLVAAETDAGSRLDSFVQAHEPRLSRSRAASLIRETHIKLNGRVVKPASTLQAGDIVDIAIPEPRALDLVPQSIPLNVVYQDPQMIIIDKPAGLTVHPAPGHPDGTLVNALLALVPGLPGIGGAQRPGIVHRLDKDTSGLIVVAKTDAAHQSLTRQLKERSIQKTYVALVTGLVKANEGTIEAPIGRNRRDRKKMAVIATGKSAVTSYRVCQRYETHLGRFTLIEAHPITGRTHQIRVHMAHSGHPLVGDAVYGKRSPLVQRHFLHAARLNLAMPPLEAERRTFETALSADLTTALAWLNGG